MLGGGCRINIIFKRIKRLYFIALSAIFFVSLVFLLGCGSNKSLVILNSIYIVPKISTIEAGSSQKFACKAIFSDNTTLEVSPLWESSSTIGTILQDGTFTAKTVSSSVEGVIIARYNNLSASMEVKILPKASIPSPEPSMEAVVKPSVLSGEVLSPYSAKILWDGVGDGFAISYGTDIFATNLGTIETSQKTYTFSSLESNTSFYFKVKAFKIVSGKKNYSEYTNVYNLKTLDYPLCFEVEGNKILDDKGVEFVFRGVNILDPGWMDAIYYNLNKNYFLKLKEWNVNIIRIPVHPLVYNYYGKDNYLKILDKVVNFAAEQKIYCIIDFHSIGFPPDLTYNHLEDFTDPWEGSIYSYTDASFKSFWNEISNHYKNNNSVVFYEIFNEIAPNNSFSNSENWILWKMKAEEIIDLIRKNDEKSKIIVGGLDYSYDLEEAFLNPISRENIVYSTHPYPGKVKAWDASFGNMKSKYPVFATEFGFDPTGESSKEYYGDALYGENLINYLEDKKISWTAWHFSPDWPPSLLSSWDYLPSISGEFFKNKLDKN